MVVLQREKAIRNALMTSMRIDKHNSLFDVFRLSIQEIEEGSFHYLLMRAIHRLISFWHQRQVHPKDLPTGLEDGEREPSSAAPIGIG